MKKINLLLICLIIFSCDKDVEQEIDSIPPVLSFEIEGVKKPETSDEIPIVGNKMEININAEDEKGISKVEAYINNTKLAKDKTAPFKLSIDLNSYNSTKKNTANKGEVFILKIVAQDNSGNTTVSEQEIYIDNTLPTISKVSLEEGAILNGIENTISFIAEDDQDITKLEVFLNNEIIEFKKLEDNNYSLSFDSTKFEDGEKTLKIVAEDAAENNTVYEVKFITDNTGPEIIFEDIKEGQVLDSIIKLTIKTFDKYSTTDSLKIAIKDTTLLNKSIDETIYSFNPELIETGDHTFNIIAKDKLGNTSIKSIKTKVKRRLFTLIVPNDYFDYPNGITAQVFLSHQNGTLIEDQKIENGKVLRYNSEVEFPTDQKFSITFYIQTSNVDPLANIFTLFDVTRSNLQYISLNTPPQLNPYQTRNYELKNFSNNSVIKTASSDHSGVQVQDSFFLSTGIWNDAGKQNTKNAYIYNYNPVDNSYSYLELIKPLENLTFLNFEDFTNTNIKTSNTSFTGLSQPMTIRLHGFKSEEDYIGNNYHELYLGKVLHNSIPYISSFNNYRTEINTNNYQVIHEGLPKTSYQKPDWQVDYTYNNSIITPYINNVENGIGKAYLINDKDPALVTYRWNIRFDANNDKSYILPNLPESLSSTQVYQNYLQSNFQLKQIEVTKYDNIKDYSDYLKLIIKNNSNNHYEVSNQVKSLFKVENDELPYFLLKEYIW